MKQTPTFNNQDHDILINLVNTVKSNHDHLLEKMAEVGGDVAEIKDGTAAQISNHESRIRIMEDIIKVYEPKPLVQMLMSHERWISEFKLTWRNASVVLVAFGGIVGFLFARIQDIVNIFIKK